METKPKTRGGKRPGAGRKPLNREKRKGIKVYLDPQSILWLDVCKTFADTNQSVKSRSGYIEKLLWDFGQAPGYEKLIKKPKL